MQAIKVNIAAIAGLAFPKTRKEAIANPPYPPFPAWRSGNIVQPDEQLDCFDYTYDCECMLFLPLEVTDDSVVGMHEDYEWNYEWSPVWKYVGRHMYFAPWLVEVADGMVKRALHISEAGERPPVSYLPRKSICVDLTPLLDYHDSYSES